MTSRDMLIERLRIRVADPQQRTDCRLSVSQQFIGTAAAEELRAARQHALDSANAMYEAHRRGEPTPRPVREQVLAEFARIKTPAAGPDLIPASKREIEKAERSLGFPLPETLAALYLEVGDGGFGPGYGLSAIGRIVEEYARLRSHDADSPWPEGMLPISSEGGDQYCIRLPGGEIVRCDVNWPEDELAEPSLIFTHVAPSIETWLESWLAHDSEAERAVVDRATNAHGTPRWFEAWIVRVAALSSKQRAKLGIEGDDWEGKLRKELLSRS